MEQTIIWIGITIFTISSIYFSYKGEKKDKLNTALIVSLITTVSYTVFLDGQFSALAPSGETIYYSRWIGYILSCTLLAYAMAQKLKISGRHKIDLLYMMGITMVTGALASVTTGWTMISFFIIGGITFMRAIKILSSGDRTVFSSISPYLWFGWSLFPVIFILSPEGYGLISTTLALIIYLVLDIYTKIIFYFNSYMK